jgi:hypothetical protein
MSQAAKGWVAAPGLDEPGCEEVGGGSGPDEPGCEEVGDRVSFSQDHNIPSIPFRNS